jgi:hypothetical protein
MLKCIGLCTDSGALNGIFGLEKEELNECRELHNEKVHNFHTLPINVMIKWRASSGEIRNSSSVLVGNLMEKE